MSNFQKSIFQPLNRQKYIGSRLPIARSSWEYKFMKFLDSNPAVLEWSSESIVIVYLNPLTGKPTRYYPDFLIKFKDTSGNEVMELIEIKPYKQTLVPKATKGKHKRTLLMEAKTYAVNSAKWKAAQEYCNLRGIRFRIMTEKDLGI